MGEHTSGRRDVRDSAALRIAVVAGFVVAGAFAYLLVAAQNDGRGSQQAVCALCVVREPAPAGAGSVPPAFPTRTGLSVAAGSATPPAETRLRTQSSNSPQSSSPSSPAPSTVSGSATTSPVTVRFTVTSQWESGYHVVVDLTNSGGVPIQDWKLVFKVPGANLNSTNGAVLTDTAGSVTATPEAWDTTIGAGATVSLGFTLDGTQQAPTGCAVSGTPCAVTYVPLKTR